MILIAAVSFARAAPSTTQAAIPATVPATQPSAELRHWFDQLADSDPAVREAARINLMGLKRDQLDQLKQLVMNDRPLAPSQAGVLHEIVIHVFLTGETYRVFPGASVIGVRLVESASSPVIGAPGDGTSQTCVVVEQRFPGFPAYRYLQDGDLLLGVKTSDLVRTSPIVATPDFETFRRLVSVKSPGDILTLQLLRRGRVIEFSFPVEATPLDSAGANANAFFDARSNKADDYWKETFVPLLGIPIS